MLHEKYGHDDLAAVFEAGTPFLPPEEGGSNHILIIDDSNQICSVLVTAIVTGCSDSGRTCQITQSSPFGLIETVPMNFSDDVFDTKVLNLYIANSPKNALPVLRQPQIKRLTIICDVMMPGDTEVGLLGLLRELTELKLPVNLLFASSEGQCRYYVEELLRNRKAYFVEKGTAAWTDLPYALVQRSQMFRYQVLARLDYDKGRLYSSREAGRKITNPPAPLPRSAVNGLEPAIPAERRVRPATKVQPKVDQVDNIYAHPAAARKSSTGLLALLTFWRWGKSQPR